MEIKFTRWVEADGFHLGQERPLELLAEFDPEFVTSVVYTRTEVCNSGSGNEQRLEVAVVQVRRDVARNTFFAGDELLVVAVAFFRGDLVADV